MMRFIFAVCNGSKIVNENERGKKKFEILTVNASVSEEKGRGIFKVDYFVEE